MRYAQTGINGFSGVDGCPGHWEKADENDPHFSIDCRLCEPFLAKDPLWAAVPSQVPQTDIEQRIADEAKARHDAVAAQAVSNLAGLLGAAAANPAALAAALQGATAQVQAAPAAPAVPAGPKRSTRSRSKTAAAKTGAKTAV